MATLDIKDLHVSVDTDEGENQILKRVAPALNSGQIPALTGPHPSLATPVAALGFAWPARVTLIREPWRWWRSRRVIRAQSRAHKAEK